MGVGTPQHVSQSDTSRCADHFEVCIIEEFLSKTISIQAALWPAFKLVF